MPEAYRPAADASPAAAKPRRPGRSGSGIMSPPTECGMHQVQTAQGRRRLPGQDGRRYLPACRITGLRARMSCRWCRAVPPTAPTAAAGQLAVAAASDRTRSDRGPGGGASLPGGAGRQRRRLPHCHRAAGVAIARAGQHRGGGAGTAGACRAELPLADPAAGCTQPNDPPAARRCVGRQVRLRSPRPIGARRAADPGNVARLPGPGDRSPRWPSRSACGRNGGGAFRYPARNHAAARRAGRRGAAARPH